MIKCPVCGGDILGDGITEYLRCENTEFILDIEVDALPVFCCSSAKRENKTVENTNYKPSFPVRVCVEK